VSPNYSPPTAARGAGAPMPFVFGGSGAGGGGLGRRGPPGSPVEAGAAPNGGGVWRAFLGPLPTARVALTAAPAADGGARPAVPPPPFSITSNDYNRDTGGAASGGRPPMVFP